MGGPNGLADHVPVNRSRTRADRSPWRTMRYIVSLPGMTDAGVSSFDVSGYWHVHHGTPGPGLVAFRNDRKTHTLDEVTFLADCFSFDHDTPTVVRPAAGTQAAKRPPIDTLFPYQSREDQTLSYYSTVESTLTEATDLRLGDGSPTLRYHEYPKLLRLHARFLGVEEPLALYAMATRQVEVLSEFLCFYRVIEWVNKDNGKAYVSRHLGALATHDFGKLWAHRTCKERRWDIFARYRRRAMRRLSELRTRHGTDQKVAQHLYDIRNSLAHGKSNFALDRDTDLPEIGRDVLIIKLLARMVIERVP